MPDSMNRMIQVVTKLPLKDLEWINYNRWRVKVSSKSASIRKTVQFASAHQEQFIQFCRHYHEANGIPLREYVGDKLLIGVTFPLDVIEWLDNIRWEIQEGTRAGVVRRIIQFADTNEEDFFDFCKYSESYKQREQCR